MLFDIWVSLKVENDSLKKLLDLHVWNSKFN